MVALILKIFLISNMGGTRIFEVGAARGQSGGHRGQTKIVVIELLTDEN